MTSYRDQFKAVAFHEPYVYPKLEELMTRGTWAISMNPGTSNSYLEFYRDSEQHFKKIFNNISLDLRPEISTKSQLWHWHGYITFHRNIDYVNFYLHIKELKDFCTFAIKPIDSWEWFVYIRKQRPVIKPYINKSYNTVSTLVPYHFKKTARMS